MSRYDPPRQAFPTFAGFFANYGHSGVAAPGKRVAVSLLPSREAKRSGVGRSCEFSPAGFSTEWIRNAAAVSVPRILSEPGGESGLCPLYKGEMMGREAKRVRMDFEWPQGKVWHGYINPHYVECPDCRAGYSASYDAIAKHLNSLMWSREVNTDANVAAITGMLAGRDARDPLGHDSLDADAAVRKLGELAGLPDGWHRCSTCKGSGVHPEHKDAYEAWEREDPPEGDGYQMWETVSEGSPISPVFPTAEDLALWLADTGASASGSMTASYEAWLRVCQGGYAPSLIGIPGQKLTSGVEGLTKETQ